MSNKQTSMTMNMIGFTHTAGTYGKIARQMHPVTLMARLMAFDAKPSGIGKAVSAASSM